MSRVEQPFSKTLKTGRWGEWRINMWLHQNPDISDVREYTLKRGTTEFRFRWDRNGQWENIVADAKVDRVAWKTGNLPFEIRQKATQGWGVSSDGTHVMVIVLGKDQAQNEGGDTLYFINLSKWRKAIGLDNIRRFKAIEEGSRDQKAVEVDIKASWKGSSQYHNWKLVPVHATQTWIVKCNIEDLKDSNIIEVEYPLGPEPDGRFLYETVTKSRRLSRVSEKARLLFFAILANCPPNGGEPDPNHPEVHWYRADPSWVKSWIPNWWGYDESNILKLLGLLERQGLIKLCHDRSGTFLCFPFGHLYPEAKSWRPKRA